MIEISGEKLDFICYYEIEKCLRRDHAKESVSVNRAVKFS